MATSWGSWEYAGGNGMRVGGDKSQTPSSVTSGTVSVVIDVDWYIQNQYNYSDSQVLTYGGGFSGSTSFTNTANDNSTQFVATKSDTVTLLYGATQSITYTATISGAYNGVTPTKSLAVTIPARPYTAPAAPSAVSATLNPNTTAWTSITVGWTRSPTTGAPYTSQNVQRRQEGGAWATIASGISGTATSYSDTTAVVGHKYEYRIQAVNTAGTTSSTTFPVVWTTPAVPTATSAVKDPSNNIVINWTNNTLFTEYQTEVWESQNGGAYSLLATVATGLATYTHVAPSAIVTHRYQMRTKTSSGTTLYSAYSTATGIIQLQAPPNAPSNLAPASVTRDAAGNIVFTWVHNPVDSSPQTQYQLQYRIVGAGSWTTLSAVSSAVSSHTITGGTLVNGNNYEWQVRTRGNDPSFGPYSATATFTASATPTASITSPLPAAVIATSSVTASITYFQANSNAMASYAAVLKDGGGNVVQTISAPLVVASGASFNVVFSGLADASAYTIEVTVLSGAGLTSAPVSVSFTVAYLPPAPVTLTAVYFEDSGTMGIDLLPSAPVGGVTVVQTSVTVQRRIDGGEWVDVATGLPPDGSIIDTMPGINNLNEYRAIVYSAIPSQAIMDPVAVTTEEKDWGFLSWGDSFENILPLGCELGATMTFGRAKELHHFARRKKAVQFLGTSTDLVWSIKGSTTPASPPDDFIEAQAESNVVLWRDPQGTRVFGSMSPLGGNVLHMHLKDVWDISFTVSEVDYAG